MLVDAHVICEGCSTEGPGFGADATEGDFTMEALEAWNRRAAPEGFVLVPAEPTDEMCAAALARIKEVTVVIDAGPAKGATLARDPYYHAYKAMLAASPQGVKDGR